MSEQSRITRHLKQASKLGKKLKGKRQFKGNIWERGGIYKRVLIKDKIPGSGRKKKKRQNTRIWKAEPAVQQEMINGRGYQKTKFLK